ncbi:hypothetical protein BGZ65_007809 [Modicella reniformis]|uniref:Uncharacterized protein n=1 Tax=Modicella reniformis TaxID=1440133 RepID=A0A9P6MB44_9FUNG|nr:hypothetical protein BGZ65_007809 [Modicella reniformis]
MEFEDILVWFIPAFIIEGIPLILATVIYEVQIVLYLFFERPTRPVCPAKSFESVAFLPWQVSKQPTSWLGLLTAWACGIIWLFSELTLDLILFVIGDTIESRSASQDTLLVYGPELKLKPAPVRASKDRSPHQKQRQQRQPEPEHRYQDPKPEPKPKVELKPAPKPELEPEPKPELEQPEEQVSHPQEEQQPRNQVQPNDSAASAYREISEFHEPAQPTNAQLSERVVVHIGVTPCGSSGGSSVAKVDAENLTLAHNSHNATEQQEVEKCRPSGQDEEGRQIPSHLTSQIAPSVDEATAYTPTHENQPEEKELQQSSDTPLVAHDEPMVSTSFPVAQEAQISNATDITPDSSSNNLSSKTLPLSVETEPSTHLRVNALVTREVESLMLPGTPSNTASTGATTNLAGFMNSNVTDRFATTTTIRGGTNPLSSLILSPTKAIAACGFYNDHTAPCPSTGEQTKAKKNKSKKKKNKNKTFDDY